MKVANTDRTKLPRSFSRLNATRFMGAMNDNILKKVITAAVGAARPMCPSSSIRPIAAGWRHLLMMR